MTSVDGYKSCDYEDHVTTAVMQKRLSQALTDVHRAWADERAEWKARISELESALANNAQVKEFQVRESKLINYIEALELATREMVDYCNGDDDGGEGIFEEHMDRFHRRFEALLAASPSTSEVKE